MSLAPGIRLSDRFTLRRLIGTGGMSQVWLAEDEVLGRPVAVKVLVAALVTDPTLRSATWTEARAAARLTHPHVTQVHDYGETALPDGTVLPYLVMELVDGQSLADRLRSGPLPWSQAVTMAAQVASALAAAHRIGVVHRDIKPANVMLTRAGVKVLDFGIAALAGDQPTDDGGRLVGTPAYASPERLRPGPATPASDVYALGVLLYEALTGHRPAPAATSGTDATPSGGAGGWRRAHHSAVPPVTPPDVVGLPRQVRRLCLACLSPDPADRPTAEELVRGLAAAAGQQPAATVTMPAVVSDPPSAGSGSPAGSGPPAGVMVGAGPWAGGAVGVAPPPDTPTMINSGFAELYPRSNDRLPRPLLALLIAAAVVLVVSVLYATSTLFSDGSEQAAQPAPSSPPAITDPDTPTPDVTQPPATPSATPPADPTANTAEAIVDQLDATVTRALAAGRIDADAADSLRDKIKDLREGLGERKVGRRIRELQRRINELRADGKIDQRTADQLTALLRPLTGG